MSNSDVKNGMEIKEDEKHLVLNHDYDNIQELNHPLPRWWNIIFFISTLYAIGYFVYYQYMGGLSLADEFNQEFSKVLAARAEFNRINSQFDRAYYESIVKNDGLKKGSEVYAINCMPCHMEKGGGDVGPNLTDKHWLIAKGTPETVHQVVFNGSEENGMPIWGEILTKEEVYQSVVYVMSLKNTHVKGKGPQGEIVED